MCYVNPCKSLSLWHPYSVSHAYSSLRTMYLLFKYVLSNRYHAYECYEACLGTLGFSFAISFLGLGPGHNTCPFKIWLICLIEISIKYHYCKKAEGKWFRLEMKDKCQRKMILMNTWFMWDLHRFLSEVINGCVS